MAFNGRKMLAEFRRFCSTWINPPPASHFGGSFVNRFVEACRVSAYAGGHLLAWGAVLCAVQWIVIWRLT